MKAQKYSSGGGIRDASESKKILFADSVYGYRDDSDTVFLERHGICVEHEADGQNRIFPHAGLQ